MAARNVRLANICLTRALSNIRFAHTIVARHLRCISSTFLAYSPACRYLPTYLHNTN